MLNITILPFRQRKKSPQNKTLCISCVPPKLPVESHLVEKQLILLSVPTAMLLPIKNHLENFNCVTMYNHWLSDDWAVVFLSELSVLEVCFLPSFLPSWFLRLVSWVDTQSRWAWTTSKTSTTHTSPCSQKTARNRKAVLSSVAVYHQKKTDLEWAELHRWGYQAGGERSTPIFCLLLVSTLLPSPVWNPCSGKGEN